MIFFIFTEKGSLAQNTLPFANKQFICEMEYRDIGNIYTKEWVTSTIPKNYKIYFKDNYISIGNENLNDFKDQNNKIIFYYIIKNENDLDSNVKHTFFKKSKKININLYVPNLYYLGPTPHLRSKKENADLWGNCKEVKLNETLNISKKNISSDLDSQLNQKEQSKNLLKQHSQEIQIKKLEEKLAKLEEEKNKKENQNSIELSKKLARLEKLEKELKKTKLNEKKLQDKKSKEIEKKIKKVENQIVQKSKVEGDKCNFNCNKKNNNSEKTLSKVNNPLNFFKPKLGEASNVINTEKSQNNKIISKCSKSLGTISIAESDGSLIRQLAIYNLPNPKKLLRIIIQKSGCFQIVERGMALKNLILERKLSESGQLQAGSNFGKSQLAASDFVLSADIIFSSSNSAGGAGVAAIGGLFGPIGSVVGAIGAGVRFKEAQTSILIVDARSGIQIAADQGNVSKTDFGMVGGFSGLGVGAFTNTAEGKLISFALLNNFNNIVKTIKNNKSLIPKNSIKSEENANLSIRKNIFKVGDILSPKINSIKVYENPVKNSKEIFKINLNENVVYLGEKKNRYILVEGSKGAGWVREILLKIKK